PIIRALDDSLAKARGIAPKQYDMHHPLSIVADPVMQYKTQADLEKRIKEVEKQMNLAAKALDFLAADQFLSELNLLYELEKNTN
ncbi:MAG: excinuclease ABC subunit B, partial [Bacteroidales bacterium]